MKPLRHYPSTVRDCTWSPLHGGYSGATLWRGEEADVPLFVMKQWPIGTTLVHLITMHQAMGVAHSALPDIVPIPMQDLRGQTVTICDRHVFDVQQWKTGKPISTTVDIQAGCKAISALHRAFANLGSRLAPAPGVRQRWKMLQEPVVLQPWPDFERQRQRTVSELLPYLDVPMRLHTIHGDLHPDHLLFNSGHVSGIIDFGATRVDLPALDFARWIGLAGTPEHLESFAGTVELGFFMVLIRASLLGSLTVWCQRKHQNQHRLRQLIEAYQRWQS